MLLALRGCCAAVPEDGELQFPSPSDEVPSFSLPNQSARCCNVVGGGELPPPSARTVASYAPDRITSTVSLPGGASAPARKISEALRQGSRKLTLLSQLHGGAAPLRSCSSATFGQKPAQTKSFASIEDLEENARIVTMVTNFAKKAVEGCQCELFVQDGARCKSIASKYYVDRSLRTLTIKTTSAADKYQQVECPLAAVEGIHTIEDGGEEFPEALLRDVSAQGDGDRLLMVSYRRNEDELASICLLAESKNAAEDFSDSLSILCASATDEGVRSA